MTEQIATKTDFVELMIGVLAAKLNARISHCPYCCKYYNISDINAGLLLTPDEIAFIRTVVDNIYMFAVADGMNRAFEALRRAGLPEEDKNV